MRDTDATVRAMLRAQARVCVTCAAIRFARVLRAAGYHAPAALIIDHAARVADEIARETERAPEPNAALNEGDVEVPHD